ncbi:hypothetical protein BJF78_09170 [Pseudonocardia sp. CNS-139]|nr:hypothetical protein BJF78_09170 [Pseudonocardia sp. CNS-139]
MEDGHTAEQEGSQVGAPVEQREDVEDVLGGAPADALPDSADAETALAAAADPDSVGTQVVPEARRPEPALLRVDLRADFGAHLEANYQRLVAQLYAITLDAGEAHDAVQDAYSRAWRNWDTIGGSPDPSAWVRRVAVRSTARSWRRTLARFGIARPRPVSDGVDPRTGALLAALGRLSPGERRAVVLHHMAGASLGGDRRAGADVRGDRAGPVGPRARRRHRGDGRRAAGRARRRGRRVRGRVRAGGTGDEGYDPAAYGDEYGDGYGSGGYPAAPNGAADRYGVDRYGSGGYDAAPYGSGGYAGYGYEPEAGANEGERR